MVLRRAVFPILFLFLFSLPVFSGSIDEAVQRAKESGSAVRSQIDGKDELMDRLITPLTREGYQMSTFGGEKFSVHPVTCRVGTAVVSVQLLPKEGGRWAVSAGYDVNDDGIPDQLFFTTPPADDICANGVGVCHYEGDGRVCAYYVFSGTSLHQAQTAGEMISCECVSDTCNAQSKRVNEADRFLEKAGWAVMMPFLNQDKSWTVGGIKKDLQNLSISFTLSRTVCSSSSLPGYGNIQDVNSLSSYYGSGTLLEERGNYILSSQAADPSSLYSLATAQMNELGNRVPCRLERTAYFERGDEEVTHYTIANGSWQGAGDCKSIVLDLSSMTDDYTWSLRVCSDDPSAIVIRCSTEECARNVSVRKSCKGCPLLFDVPDGCDCEVVRDDTSGVGRICGHHPECVYCNDYCKHGPCRLELTVTPDSKGYYRVTYCETGDEGSEMSADFELHTVHYTYHEDFSNTCSQFEDDPDCRLKEAATDGVERVKNYQVYFPVPEGSCIMEPAGVPEGYKCRKISKGSNGMVNVCCPFWKEERTYICTDRPNRFDFTDALNRADVINSSVSDAWSGSWMSMNYNDIPSGGSLQSFSGSAWAGGGECVRVCVVRKRAVDTRTGYAGTASDYQIDNTQSRPMETRLCIPEESGWQCPVSQNEEVVENCECRSSISQNLFSDAYMYMSHLLILSGKDVDCIGTWE